VCNIRIASLTGTTLPGSPWLTKEIRMRDVMHAFVVALRAASHLTVPRRCLAATGIALVLICPAVAQAQQPARATLAFKATVSGIADALILPTDPPVASARLNFKGTSELLGGATSYVDIHTGHFGIDGAWLGLTDAIGVFTGPTGDALFVQWFAAGRPTEKAGIYTGTGAFRVSGGRGRFAGATGSGIVTSVVNLNTLEVTHGWDGLVVLPKQ
jgi:hypothetical protein